MGKKAVKKSENNLKDLTNETQIVIITDPKDKRAPLGKSVVVSKGKVVGSQG